MNTKTILNLKTDKKLKNEAQKIAEEIGLSLSAILNSFLRQFVLDKEVTFSSKKYRMTDYLEGVVQDARSEYKKGESNGPFKSVDDFMTSLDK